MKSSGTNHSYIVRNPYSYCFRIIVPQDLYRFVGKKELRYTLKTGRLGIAKKKSRYLAGQIQAIFRVLRKGEFVTVNLSEDKIKELVNNYIKQSVERINKLFFDDPEDYPPFTTESEFYSYLREMDGMRDDLIANLNRGNYGMLENEILSFLKSQGIDDVDKNSVEYRKLCAGICQAEIKLLPIEKRHRLNDFSYEKELPDIFPEVFEFKKAEPVPAPDPPKEEPSKPLEVVIEEYSKENELAGNWSKRTMIEYRSIFNNILKLIGNVPVNTIDRQDVVDFKQTLQAIPADYFKATKKYESIPISKVIKNKPKKTLTAKTVNKYITNLSAVFNYACIHGYMKNNYASGMKIRLKRKRGKERDQFSNEDLTALFHSKEYTEDTFDVPWKFWLPILGLFTGCRLEELCQPTLSDIKQDHGIWVLDVKEDLELGKKQKLNVQTD